MNDKQFEGESLASGYSYAGFWIRTVALLVDGILLTLITLPILYGIYGDAYLEADKLVHGFADLSLSYIFPFVATVLFWTYKSATPGKMLVRTKVVDAKTGCAPSLQQSILRYLGYFLSTLVLGLGFFWAAWDSKKQGWHDKIAGTLVIYL